MAAFVAAAALSGCGGGGKTSTTVTRTATVTASDTRTSTSVTATSTQGASEVPSTAEADRYAHRTYVVQQPVGKRVFKVDGPAETVTASDGSKITAFNMLLADSGDGSGQAVLLFRGAKFLGWASDHLSIHLSVASAGSAIAVRYGAYSGNDPFCCPSSHKTVNYSWNGSQIVADGDPPLDYGKPGDKLHLAP
jgi:LppP/LprE lipoprotein